MRSAWIVRGLVAAVAWWVASAPSAAQLCERDVLFGPDFGHDVSIDRRLLAVGSPGSNATFVYRLATGGWQVETPLVGPLPGEFGSAVDIDVATLAVGAPGEAAQQGAVYAHRRIGNVWVQTQRLTSSDGSTNRFGESVAVRADVLVVGAPADGDTASFGGAAYVFERSASGAPWIETQKLVAADGTALDAFGYAVDVDDDVIVVGAPRAGAGGADAGAVYVFERVGDRFVQTARLSDPAPRTADLFGRAVAIDARSAATPIDDVVWIGAPLDDDAAPDAGSVTVARRAGDTWTLTQKLLLDTADPLDLFGSSLALRGSRGVAGAPGRQAGVGAAVVYSDEGASVAPLEEVAGSFGGSTLGYGTSVDLTQGLAVVGADTLLAPASAVYLYGGLAPWADLGQAVSGPLGAPQLAVEGSLCPSTPLAMQLDGALPSTLGALVVGFYAVSAPFKGGVLVPNPDVLFGLGTSPLGELSLATTWPPDFPPGVDLILQAWIDDPGGPAGFTASNAVGALTP